MSRRNSITVVFIGMNTCKDYRQKWCDFNLLTKPITEHVTQLFHFKLSLRVSIQIKKRKVYCMIPVWIWFSQTAMYRYTGHVSMGPAITCILYIYVKQVVDICSNFAWNNFDWYWPKRKQSKAIVYCLYYTKPVYMCVCYCVPSVPSYLVKQSSV